DGRNFYRSFRSTKRIDPSRRTRRSSRRSTIERKIWVLRRTDEKAVLEPANFQTAPQETGSADSRMRRCPPELARTCAQSRQHFSVSPRIEHALSLWFR